LWFNIFSVPPIIILCTVTHCCQQYFKCFFVLELIVYVCACDLCLGLILLFNSFYNLIFITTLAHLWIMAGIPLVVRVPQFCKPLSRVRAKGPSVAAVQRHNLAPSTWTTIILVLHLVLASYGHGLSPHRRFRGRQLTPTLCQHRKQKPGSKSTVIHNGSQKHLVRTHLCYTLTKTLSASDAIDSFTRRVWSLGLVRPRTTLVK
jgi:hypothetical protein